MPDSPDNQAAIPPQPPIPPQPYQPVMTPPPKKGPSAMKIVLIIVAIIGGIVLIGAGVIGYGVYKVSKAIHMSDNSTPVTASDLGVAIYPGAVQGKGSLRMTIAGKNMVTANFLTSDSKEQVIAFYQAQLGSGAQGTPTSSGEILVVTKGNGNSLTVTISQRPNLNDGKTQIVIASVSTASK